MSSQETLMKYDRIRKMRDYAGFEDGEYCPICLSRNSRDKEKNVCDFCQYIFQPIFGFVFGVPVYDIRDAKELKFEDPFKMYTSGVTTI